MSLLKLRKSRKSSSADVIIGAKDAANRHSGVHEHVVTAQTQQEPVQQSSTPPRQHVEAHKTSPRSAESGSPPQQTEHSTSPQLATHGGLQVGGLLKALYAYTAQDGTAFNFDKGDLLDVRKIVDSNWVIARKLGDLHASEGLVPRNYVKVIRIGPAHHLSGMKKQGSKQDVV